MKKVKPAIFSGPLGWGWVRLKELAEIIGQSPVEVWEKFFSLSKDLDILAVSPDLKEVWNVSESGYIAYSGDRYAFGSPEAFRKALKAGSFYVPAGWAMEVIRARELGAESLRVKFADQLTEEEAAATLLVRREVDRLVAVLGVKGDGNLIKGASVPKWYIYPDPDGYYRVWGPFPNIATARAVVGKVTQEEEFSSEEAALKAASERERLPKPRWFVLKNIATGEATVISVETRPELYQLQSDIAGGNAVECESEEEALQYAREWEIDL